MNERFIDVLGQWVMHCGCGGWLHMGADGQLEIRSIVGKVLERLDPEHVVIRRVLGELIVVTE